MAIREIIKRNSSQIAVGAPIGVGVIVAIVLHPACGNNFCAYGPMVNLFATTLVNDKTWVILSFVTASVGALVFVVGSKVERLWLLDVGLFFFGLLLALIFINLAGPITCPQYFSGSCPEPGP